MKHFPIWLLLALLSFALLVAADSDASDDSGDESVADIPSPLQIKLDSLSSNERPTTFEFFLQVLTFEEMKLEILVVSILLGYFIYYLRQKQKNSDMARAWVGASLDVWNENFAQVGPSPNAALVRDGSNDFIFFASGRNYVQHVYATISLAPIYDPYIYAISMINRRKYEDKATVTFKIDGECTDSFVFAIIAKQKAEKLIKGRYDLYEFTKSRDFPNFPKAYYTINSDTNEFLANLLADPLVLEKFWKTCGLDAKGQGTPFKFPIITSIIFSDLPSVKPVKLDEVQQDKILTFEMRFPEAPMDSQLFRDSLSNAVKLMMDIVDYLGQHGRLTSETNAKLKRVRDGANKHLLKEAEAERKEELANRKIREAKERAEAISKMSPELQRKLEEKERKKKNKGKRAMVSYR